jgi:hypothetical protein
MVMVMMMMLVFVTDIYVWLTGGQESGFRRLY